MRQCGTCTRCCHTLGVPSINKERDQRCPNLTVRGCGIYRDRPQECRDFACLWLQGIVPKELRPDKINAVLTANATGDIIIVAILPQHRGAHRKSPLREWIDGAAGRGVSIIVTCGDDRSAFGPVASDPRLVQLQRNR